jgi:hypothetical protein
MKYHHNDMKKKWFGICRQVKEFIPRKGLSVRHLSKGRILDNVGITFGPSLVYVHCIYAQDNNVKLCKFIIYKI